MQLHEKENVRTARRSICMSHDSSCMMNTGKYCTMSGAHGCHPGRVQNDFYLQRIWIVKDSTPIARFFAVVYVCNAPSTSE